MPQPVKQILPPIEKCIDVTIDESIKDSEILAIVSALIGAQKSAQLKHEHLMKPRLIEQEVKLTIHIQTTDEMFRKGISALIDKLVLCSHSFNWVPISCKPILTQTLEYQTIYNLAQPSGRAFAQAAGILIGAEANAVFDLKPAVEGMHKDVENLATFIDVPNSDSNLLKFYDEIAKLSHNHGFIHEWFKIGDHTHYKHMLQQVLDSSLVVGPPSFYTYAAACLEIPVIEIFDTREQLSIFSKWASLRYAAVLLEEAQHVRAERLETLWAHWHHEGLIETAQETSIVVDADG